MNKIFASGQAIPDASIGVFTPDLARPLCGRPQKLNVDTPQATGN